MKKRILSLLLALLMVLSLLPTVAFAAIEDYPIPDYGPQAQGAAAQKFIDGEVMSVAHRAAWRHGPENSLLAIAAAIEIGADVVELDVALSKDKVLVLSHDATINRCVVSKTGKVSDYTWEELSRMRLENGTGGSDKAYRLTESDVEVLNSLSNYAEHSGGPAEVRGTLPLTRMDDAIELIDRRAMINLDKCTTEEIFVACYILFRETDMLDHVFFKNSVSGSTLASWCETAANAWNEKHPDEPLTKEDVQQSFIYAYVLSSSNTSALQGHLNAGNPLKMVELVISNATVEKAFKAADEVWCKEHDIAMFVNTMWSGLADTRPDSETCWAEMIDRGYTVIQTDRPSELVKYLNETHLTDRASDSTVEAEHFSDLCYEDDFALSVPLAGDDELNKTVDGIQNGEWLAYDNIVFDGDEAVISINGSDIHDLAYVTVYVDEMTDEGLIAEGRLSESTAIALNKTVKAGKHTVYLQVIGAPGIGLATLDSFTFVSSEKLSGCTAEPVYVTTEQGEAPVLPCTVSYSDGENTYDLAVKWEHISASDCTAEGYFPVLGYVYALKDYVTATVIVTSGQDAAYHGDIPVNYSAGDTGVTVNGLLVWLDGSVGLTHTDGKVTAWINKADESQVATVKGSAPTYAENAVNGKAGIDFDGSTSLQLTLDSGALNGLEGATIIAYTNTRTPYLTSKETSNSAAWKAQRRTLLYAGENGGSWGSVYMGVYTDYLSARIGTGTNNDNGYYKSRSDSVKGFSSTAVVWDGMNKTYTVAVDGEAVGTGSSLGTVSKNNSNVLYIGEGKDAGTFGGWDGTLTELLIYDRALSDSELQSVVNYLDAKYVPEVPPVYVSGVYLKEENEQLDVTVGDEHTLSAAVVPADADNSGLIWQSSDPDIVSVDGNGRIKANTIGCAIITVTTAEGRFSASCAVRVAKTYPESLWEDICNMVSWAQSRDGDSYDGREAMEKAIAATDGMSADSSVESLEKAYKALREAKLGLTLKEHSHTYGKPYVITKATYEKTGLELLTCTVCWQTEERVIPILEKPQFTDVAEGAWYEEAVYYAAQHGIMGGVATGRFDPEGTTTRAMVVQVLYNMEGKPDVSSVQTPFTDISGKWYEAAVKWAYSSQVVNGVSPTTFDPEGKITREQFATILFRYSAYKGYSVSERADLSAYKDAAKISGYAKDAMSWANALGYIGGMTADTLVPTGNATRAQMAQIMMRFMENI